MKLRTWLLFLPIVGFLWWLGTVYNQSQSVKISPKSLSAPSPTSQPLNPLSIAAMRQRTYHTSEIVIEKELPAGSNYRQYIVSYTSDGLKINALLTIPEGEKPQAGWPAIIFNHGYIPPEVYQTTERYIAYVDAFAAKGYVVFKSDYRGNGVSQGEPEGAYYSPAYAIDILNALSAVKHFKDVNPNKIGMWGHSMGGNITLRTLVVNTNDIKAAVIWGGVVGSYEDLMFNWRRRTPFQPSQREFALRNRTRQNLIDNYGDPRQNPQFWNTLDPTFFIGDITTPIQLDVGEADEEVPVAFSQSLRDKLKQANKSVEYYSNPGSDHNISQNLQLALDHSVAFFNKYLK